MKKFKSNFLFLLFFIPLCFNFSVTSTNGCDSFNVVSEKYSEELILTKALQDLAKRGFETKQLEINQMTKEDYYILANYLLDSDVTKYLVIGNTLKFYNVNHAKYYVENLDRVHTATFALRLKDSKKTIGILGFSFQNMGKGRVINISYWLGKEYQNKGYAKECIPMIVNEAFNNIGTLKFYIDFRTKNIAAKKLADSIIEYIKENNSESSKLIVEKFNCFRLDTEEYLISKKPEDKNIEKLVA